MACWCRLGELDASSGACVARRPRLRAMLGDRRRSVKSAVTVLSKHNSASFLQKSESGTFIVTYGSQNILKRTKKQPQPPQNHPQTTPKPLLGRFWGMVVGCSGGGGGCFGTPWISIGTLISSLRQVFLRHASLVDTNLTQSSARRRLLCCSRSRTTSTRNRRSSNRTHRRVARFFGMLIQKEGHLREKLGTVSG